MTEMRRSVLFLLIPGFIFGCRGGQATSLSSADCTAEDRALFDRYVRAMEAKKTFSSGLLTLETARFFLETPYLVATLEKEPERLVVNLREMDCMTLVETCVALARTMKEDQPSFEVFCSYLQQLRYRNGEIHGYADRLHYFSDWIFENERKGWVRDVTHTIGGTPYRPDVFFMSTHPENYSALRTHPERVREIRAREQAISAREHCAMIPADTVAACSGGMRDGDISILTTSIFSFLPPFSSRD